jgi:hypothetical protein
MRHNGIIIDLAKYLEWSLMFIWIVEELIFYLTDKTQHSYYKDWLVVQDFQEANRC